MRHLDGTACHHRNHACGRVRPGLASRLARALRRAVRLTS